MLIRGFFDQTAHLDLIFFILESVLVTANITVEFSIPKHITHMSSIIVKNIQSQHP